MPWKECNKMDERVRFVAYFNEDSCRLEPIEDPFGSKVLPMSSE
jgi:hypothetical protein